MLSSDAEEWNARQKRALEYQNTEGRALCGIERELCKIRVLLEALYQHLGGTEGEKP
jgi:hypothetical protein